MVCRGLFNFEAYLSMGPYYLLMFWAHTPNIAIVSYTSKIPQDDLGNHFPLI